MRSQDNSKLNISVQLKENSFIKGRKLDSFTNTPLVINSREHSQYINANKMEENDLLLANLINNPIKTKTKKKKKKKSTVSKSNTQVTKISNDKIEKQQKPKHIQYSIPKPQKQKKSNTVPLFNWGVNQERLKNYVLNEQMKQKTIQEQMLKRVNKTDLDLKVRRDQLGVSFLNNVSIEKFTKKKKTNKSQTPTKKEQPKVKLQANQEEIKKYKEFKQKMKIIEKQEQRRKEYERQLKIHQNLQNLNQFIKSRNRSLSVGDTKQRKRNRTASTYGIIYEDQKENIISNRNQQKKKRKVLLQFKNQSDKSKFVQNSNHESMRQPCSSIYQYMSNSSSANIPNESDPEQDFANFDNSFYSQKLVTLGEENDELVSSQRDWDEQDKKEIEEIRSIEQAASKQSEKPQKSETDEQAALKIQKVWRGYKTRQILSYYQDYFKKEDEQAEFDLNDLHQSQIQELIKMGYIRIDSQGQIKLIEQDQSHKSSKSSQENKNKKNNSKFPEIKGTNNIFDAEAYQDYIEGFSDSIDSKGNRKTDKKQFLSAISEQLDLENCRESTEKNQISTTQQIAFKKKKKLSIDVDEIEKEYQNQQQVEIGEIRCAIGSESLIKSLSQEDQNFNQEKSIFEQSSFQDFMQTKFKELLSRDKMDELIAMREKVLEERHKQQVKTINEALQNKQISPKTFDQQNRKLEKWVTKQRKDLEKKKNEIIKGQQSTYETVMKTQRDIIFMKQISQSNSQSYIKIIDSFSQESVLYSEQSLRNSIIDIQNQNIFQLQQQQQIQSSLLSDEDLSKSQHFDDEIIFKNTTSPSHNQYADQEPEPFNLQQLAQSQVLRISDIVKETQNKVSEKQAESYAIVITNMLIQNEIQLLCQELGKENIDIFEIVSRAQIARPVSQLQNSQGINISKGFKTNIPSVKLYLNNLSEYMLKNFNQEIINKLNVPLGPSSKDMLKFLHTVSESTILSDDEQNSYDNYSQNIILTAEFFGQFEKYLINEQILKSNNAQMLELEHIHNKAIFDALNEALDYHRPFGIVGQPFAWKSDPSRLQLRKKDAIDLSNVVRQSLDKVLEWCHYLAGFLIDKEDCPYPKILMFDQECLAQIKEDRMIRMLSAEVIETEDRWINYDEEFTEVSIDISDMIFDHLLREVLDEITL